MNLLKKFFNSSNKSRLIRTAVKIACKEVASNLSAKPNLPSGKTAIPLTVKSQVFPLPVVICGALVDDRPNFNTLGNFGLIDPTRPNPVIYVSSFKKHYTNIGIRRNSYFSVNIPSRNIMARTDYLGVVSGHTTDKSKVMTVFFGREKSAPCLKECPLNYVCKVIHHIEVKDKDLFIGEVVESFVSSEFLTEKGIDIERIEPLLFTADGYYRVPSEPVGKAFRIFKEYSERGQKPGQTTEGTVSH
ncbi:MAG: flavin reductase family protein [Fibrobacter sp.]|nr:flavin reductase family protein [Fibrobacter sp.]